MAALARRQKGNVTRAQLLAAGFSRTVIDRRVRRGSLHARFPGVYLVGHRAEPPLSRECAALLYCGPRTMLSHRTASRITDLPTPSFDGIEVTLVGRRHRSGDGLIVYSIDAIEPHELRRHCGLPITSPSLTLLDLAGRVTRAELARALNEARVQDLVSDGELTATLRAHPNRRGARALAQFLRSEEAEFVVESEAERRCLKLMMRYGLKPDAAGAEIGPYRVDFLYEEERLIVEVDGYRFHRTRQRFVGDRRRRAALMAWGYEVFPITWADLVDRPSAAMSDLRAARERRRRDLGLASCT